MTKKLMGIRLNQETTLRLDAWSIMLKQEKTKIIEESFLLWEIAHHATEIISVHTIVEELKKHSLAFYGLDKRSELPCRRKY